MSFVNKKKESKIPRPPGVGGGGSLPPISSLLFERIINPRTLRVSWTGGGSRELLFYDDSDTFFHGSVQASPYVYEVNLPGRYYVEAEDLTSGFVYALTDAPTGDMTYDPANDRLIVFLGNPVTGGSQARIRLRKNSGDWTSYALVDFDILLYFPNGDVGNPDSFSWSPGDVIDMQVYSLVNTNVAQPDASTAGESIVISAVAVPLDSAFLGYGGDDTAVNIFELENDLTNYVSGADGTLTTGATLVGDGTSLSPYGVQATANGCLQTNDNAAATDFLAVVSFKSNTFPGTGTQPTEQQILQKYISTAQDGRFRFHLKNQVPRAWTYVNSGSSFSVLADDFEKALNEVQFLAIMRNASTGKITIWNEAGESVTGDFGTHAFYAGDPLKFFLTEGNGQMTGYFAVSANKVVTEANLYTLYWEPARQTINDIKSFVIPALNAPSIVATMTYAEAGSAVLQVSGGWQKSGDVKYTFAKVSGALTLASDGTVSGGAAGSYEIVVTATDARGVSSGNIAVAVTVTATGTGSGYNWDFDSIPGLPTPTLSQVASGSLPSGWSASDNSGTYYGGGTAQPAHSASGGSTDVSRKYYLRRSNGAIYSKANKTGAAITTLPSDSVASWDFEIGGLLWYQDKSTRELKSLQITDNGGGSFSTSINTYANLSGFNSFYGRSQTKIFFGGESEGIVCGRTVPGEGKFVFVHTYNNSTLCVVAAYNVAAHTTLNSGWCTNSRTETVQVSGSYFDFGGMAELGNAAGIKSRPQSTGYSVPYYFWRITASGLSTRITASENGVGHSWAGTMVIAGVPTPVWMGPQGSTMKVYNMLTGAKVAEYTIEGDFSSQGHGGPIKGSDWSYCTDSGGNATAFKNDGTKGSALGTGFIKTSNSDSNLDIEGINPDNLSQVCIVSYASPAGPIRERTYSN